MLIERVLDSIHIAFQLGCDSQPQRAANFVLDVSQQVERRPWRAPDGFRSMTRSSEYFLYSQDRLALAVEHLRVLGFPSNSKLDGLTGANLRCLSGDAMAMPCVTLLLLCILHAMSKQTPTV